MKYEISYSVAIGSYTARRIGSRGKQKKEKRAIYTDLFEHLMSMFKLEFSEEQDVKFVIDVTLHNKSGYKRVPIWSPGFPESTVWFKNTYFRYWEHGPRQTVLACSVEDFLNFTKYKKMPKVLFVKLLYVK